MTAPKVQTPAVGAGAAWNQGKEQFDFDIRGAGVQAPQDDAERVFSSMQASAALLGCTLHSLACGGYLLGRWTVCRELPDLAAVGALLRQMRARG